MLFASCLATGPSRAADTQVTYPEVSEKDCPAEVISIAGKDGNQVTAVVRKPPGKGPFPAIVFLHGGLVPRPLENLKKEALTQPLQTRFLAAGFVTISATFRSRERDPQTRDALEDCLSMIDHVKKIPVVDPKSVVVMGGSGGGSLALEIAGETSVCAVAAGEPASVLLTGMMTAGMKQQTAAFQNMMADPKSYYTPELQKFTREKIARVRCPIFIGHGDKHPINKINDEIVIPELRAAGKQVEVIAYPGQRHGFYNGNGDPEAGDKFFHDAHSFFTRHLLTQPTPLEESLVKQAPTRTARGR